MSRCVRLQDCPSHPHLARPRNLTSSPGCGWPRVRGWVTDCGPARCLPSRQELGPHRLAAGGLWLGTSAPSFSTWSPHLQSCCWVWGAAGGLAGQGNSSPRDGPQPASLGGGPPPENPTRRILGSLSLHEGWMATDSHRQRWSQPLPTVTRVPWQRTILSRGQKVPGGVPAGRVALVPGQHVWEPWFPFADLGTL